jgi:hypothetical protein
MARRSLAAASLLALLAACGPPARPSLPSGDGTPFPEFAGAYEEAVQTCAAVHTITAELSLSGRAGTTKLRGKINAGLAAPSDIVLEGLAPFGKPVFILTGRGGTATLFLPRDNRVLTGAEPSKIVEALAGVALNPAQLLSVLAGCGLEKIVPSTGRRYGGSWAAVESGPATVFLRQAEGRWHIAASTGTAVSVQYSDFQGGRYRTVFVKTTVTDLAVRISDVDVTTPIDRRAFTLEVPKDAIPITLEELRRAGPLGDKGDRES